MYVGQASDIPVSGAKAFIFGALVSGTEPIAKRRLTVSITPVGSTVPVKVLHLTTTKRGGFQLAHRSRTSFDYTVEFAGDDDYDPVSTGGQQAVAARVRLARPGHPIRAGKVAVFRGHVRPAVAGTKVRLYQGVKGAVCGVGVPPAKRLLGTARVRADGSFAVRATFATRGVKPVFAAVAATGSNAAGHTAYKSVKVV